MKKSTLTLLILGFVFVLFGGITAITTYPKAEKEAVTHYKKDYTLSGDTLYLDISTDEYYYLYSTNSDTLQIRSTYLNFYHPDLVTEQKKAPSGDTITISEKERAATTKKNMLFNGIFNEQQDISIGLPSSVKHLVLNGGRGNLESLTLTSLKIQGKTDKVLSVSNLIADELTTEGDFLSLSLNDSLVEKVTFKATNGSFSNSNNKISTAEVVGKNLSFSAYGNTINKLAATLTKGDFSLGQHTGEATLTGTNVSVNLSDEISGNLDLTVKRGNFNGDFYNSDSQPQAIITGETAAGKVNLFGKSSPYKAGQGTYKWHLVTSLGDITLSGMEEYDEEYDNEEDPEEDLNQVDEDATSGLEESEDSSDEPFKAATVSSSNF